MSEARLEVQQRLDRSRARAWLLQIHYRWESEGARGALAEALQGTMATRHVSPRRLPYIRLVVGLLDQHRAAVD